MPKCPKCDKEIHSVVYRQEGYAGWDKEEEAWVKSTISPELIEVRCPHCNANLIKELPNMNKRKKRGGPRVQNPHAGPAGK